VRRWLVLSLGFGIAAVAGYALITSSPARSLHRDAVSAGASGAPADPHSHGAPHDEIGDDSRAKLEEILLDADAEDSRRR
jgi:hypothetical protein